MSKFETIRLLLLIPKLPMGDAVENETGEKGAGEITVGILRKSDELAGAKGKSSGSI
jgi:hypothetical protein